MFKKVKRNAVLSILALLIGITAVPFASLAAYPAIVIDGNTSDWSAISPAATNTGELTSLKVANDGCQLFILLQGSNLDTASHISFFIDADNNDATGYYASGWAWNGADFLLENTFPYAHQGATQFDYDWGTKIADVAVFKSANVMELYVPLSLLGIGPGDTINIGVMKDFSTANRLPAENDPLAAVTLLTDSGSSSVNWNSVAPLATGSSDVASLKAAHDGCTLHLRADGVNFSTATYRNFYLNSDNDPATGYWASGWEYAGADHMIENGHLYAFTGTSNTSWSWSYVGPVAWDADGTKVEASVPLAAIGASLDGVVRVGFVVDNSASKMLPEADEYLPHYTLLDPYTPMPPAASEDWDWIMNYNLIYALDMFFNYSQMENYDMIVVDPRGTSKTTLSTLKAYNPDQ